MSILVLENQQGEQALSGAHLLIQWMINYRNYKFYRVGLKGLGKVTLTLLMKSSKQIQDFNCREDQPEELLLSISVTEIKIKKQDSSIYTFWSLFSPIGTT